MRHHSIPVRFFLFLLLGAIALVQMRRASQDKLLLQEKEEKILVLSKVYAEKEQEHLHKELALEKEILKLTHSNESLELKLKEGTKNQVVTKIEELENKNARRYKTDLLHKCRLFDVTRVNRTNQSERDFRNF